MNETNWRWGWPDRNSNEGIFLERMIDVILFAATAFMAYLFRWQATDLVWSLWLSSLVVGYAMIATSIFRDAGRSSSHPSESLPLVLRIGGGFFMLGFFSVHFGGFHVGHAVFLNLSFPLIGYDESMVDPFHGALVPFVKIVFFSYWPVVIATFIAKRRVFLDMKEGFNMFTPYINVVRIHLLIFALIFLRILKPDLDERWLYLGIFFFFFFPLSSLLGLFFRKVGQAKSLP